jgi:hypothetical protein
MYGFLIRLNPLKARFSCFPPRRGEAFSLVSPPRRVPLGIGVWDSYLGGGSSELPPGSRPQERHHGGCSSEPPPRCSLQPSLYLGACSFERFPKRLLFGGTTAGIAHGVLPKMALLGGFTAGITLMECFSRSGSSEPPLEDLSIEWPPWSLFKGASPLAAVLRNHHLGFCSIESFP